MYVEQLCVVAILIHVVFVVSKCWSTTSLTRSGVLKGLVGVLPDATNGAVDPESGLPVVEEDIGDEERVITV